MRPRAPTLAVTTITRSHFSAHTRVNYSALTAMPENFEISESPFIRIARNGAVTQHSTAERGYLSEHPFEDDGEPITVRAARPMPKRLSEEAREAAMIDSTLPEMPEAYSMPAEEKKATKPKTSRKSKTAKKPEAEQMALPLKLPKEKPDTLVKQRQVLGFACIVAALLVLLAMVSYTPDDAPHAETKLSDIPAIFLGTDPVINAHADQVHNWLRLLGAMLANLLINKTIGYAAIIYPIFFGAWSLAFFKFTYKQRRRLTLATTFFLITAVLFSATMGTASNFVNLPREWFGSVGAFLGLAFTRAIGGAGAFILYAASFIIMLVFSIDLDIERTFLRMKGWWSTGVMWSRRKMIEFWDKREAKQLARTARREAEEAEEEEAKRRAMLDAPVVESIAEVGTANAESAEGASSLEEAIPQQVEEAWKPITLATNLEKRLERKARPVILDAAPTEIAPPVAVASTEAPALVIRKVAKEQIAPALEKPAPPTQVIPGQPLLKVRPAPSGTTIPRMTRSEKDRLGSRSVNFSRLTNGAIPEETKPTVLPIQTIASPVAPPPIIPTGETASQVESPIAIESISESFASIAEVDATNFEDAADTGSNIDSSEEMISPFRPKVKVKKIIEPPIALGDEKVLSNEALPHSVVDEPSIAFITATAESIDTLAADKALLNPFGEDSDLFFEEGVKPVIPENPYLEMLTKFKNPGYDILTPLDPKDELDADDEELAKKGRLLRDKLATFGVDIENITVTPGPVVTLYEFTPAEGVKVSRVENLTDDIALAMKARGIRIIAPIPGRGTIGVEIPNDVPKMVRIRPLLESESFRNTKMNLPLALGKTISGDVYVDDLNRMPHLLIAGATGSGKSVGVNGIIASLLYAKSPRDVKFVIIDPKKIELSLYKKLRKHYLIVSPEAGEDIVTTPAYAVLALKAVEIEMERRYDKLAKAAVRSLADYNIKVAQGKLRSTQEEQHYHLPYIVVVIDELADLMITAGKEIEEPICRIAQMARAVGIHLILATQRPSVDVITGVIKANFPARIAFQVATRVDSRTILDGMGAEQLLGNGDMLYQPSGTPKPIRLQSPFISTEEVEAIIDAVASQEGDKLSYTRPWTLPSLRGKESGGGSSWDEEEDARDPLFADAAQVIVRHQQGSVSLLQRRLKVGYSRAARIVDELEQAGIVGAFDGSKARQVLCESEAELEVVLEGLR